MKALAKKAFGYVETRGYLFDHTNTKGFRVYRDDAGHELAISPGIDEIAFRNLCRTADRTAGIGPDLTQKRKPEQIRLRAERQRELDRLRDLARQHKAELLAGKGAGMSLRDVYAKERQVEAYERRIREIEALMRPEAS